MLSVSSSRYLCVGRSDGPCKLICTAVRSAPNNQKQWALEMLPVYKSSHRASILLLAAPKDPSFGRSGQPFPRSLERLGKPVDGSIVCISSAFETTNRCYSHARTLRQFFLRKSCTFSHCCQSGYWHAPGVVCHAVVCIPPV